MKTFSISPLSLRLCGRRCLQHPVCGYNLQGDSSSPLRWLQFWSLDRRLCIRDGKCDHIRECRSCCDQFHSNIQGTPILEPTVIQLPSYLPFSLLPTFFAELINSFAIPPARIAIAPTSARWTVHWSSSLRCRRWEYLETLPLYPARFLASLQHQGHRLLPRWRSIRIWLCRIEVPAWY